MKGLFDNLYLYEIVLLFLGVFLFMLLCAGLVYFIVKKDDLKKLLWFFPIPIIMIAYPSIQEIQIEKDKFALKKFTEEVIEHPDDTVAKQELIKITEKLEKRATDIEDIKAVAEANLVLGNSEKVIDFTEKIIDETKKEEKELSGDTKTDTIDAASAVSQKRKKVTTLKDINKIARIQKEIQTNPEALKDTARLKEQINKMEWQNPKTKNYLNTRIIRQLKKDTIRN